jgi:hypothetical protein
VSGDTVIPSPQGPLVTAVIRGRNKEQLRKDWIKCWNAMPQEKIQAWIERIPLHIKEIIACDGNNLYQEGREKGKEK